MGSLRAFLYTFPGTPLDTRVLTPLISAADPEQFVVFIDGAAGNSVKELGFFWEDMRSKRLPITLLLEERKNQWLVATTAGNDKTRSD